MYSADPIILSILDGKTLQIFLEDEDDFAMLAENLFTDLDIEDRGKIRKSEMQSALLHMGIEMGIPPFSGSLSFSLSLSPSLSLSRNYIFLELNISYKYAMFSLLWVIFPPKHQQIIWKKLYNKIY